MKDQDHPVAEPESWRVVVFTTLPGGMAYTQLDEVVHRLGHAIVGVVTTPDRNGVAVETISMSSRRSRRVLMSSSPPTPSGGPRC